MFMFLDREKIAEVENQIIKDYSEKTGTAYTLPFTFSKPTRVKGSTYRVSTDVVKFENLLYPVDVFLNIGEHEGVPVLFLVPEYESLGNFCLPSEYSISYGIMFKGKTLEDVLDSVDAVEFEIDAKKGTYTPVQKSLEGEKPLQQGE